MSAANDLTDPDRRRLLGAGAMAVAGARLVFYNEDIHLVDTELDPAYCEEALVKTTWQNRRTPSYVQRRQTCWQVSTYAKRGQIRKNNVKLGVCA